MSSPGSVGLHVCAAVLVGAGEHVEGELGTDSDVRSTAKASCANDVGSTMPLSAPARSPRPRRRRSTTVGSEARS